MLASKSDIASNLITHFGKYIYRGGETPMKLSKTIMFLFLLVIVVSTLGCQAAQRPEPAGYDRTQNGFNNANRVGYDNTNPLNGGIEGFDQGLNRGGLFGRDNNMFGLRGDNDLMNGRAGNGSQNNSTSQLEQRIEQIAGVNDATVVTDGNTCYVGLDMDQNGNNRGMNNANNGRMNGTNGMNGMNDMNGHGMSGQFGQNGQARLTGQNQANQGMQIEQVKSRVRQVLAQDGRFSNIIISEDRDFGQQLGDIANQISTGRPVAEFGDALRDLGRTITPTRAR